MAGEKIKVLVVVEDQPDMQLLIALHLQRDPRLEIYGKAASAAEARRTVTGSVLGGRESDTPLSMPGERGSPWTTKEGTRRSGSPPVTASAAQCCAEAQARTLTSSGMPGPKVVETAAFWM